MLLLLLILHRATSRQEAYQSEAAAKLEAIEELKQTRERKKRVEAKLQSVNAHNASVMTARRARNEAEARVDELSLVVQDLRKQVAKAQKRLLCILSFVLLCML